MQMYWTSSFKSRMMFNAGKAYVKQLKKGRKYKNLCPVYGLSLVNEDFQLSKSMEKNYYHHYKMSHSDFPDDYIKGIELIFVELKKFKALNFRDKRLRVLWLRFLTEIDEETTTVPKELLVEPAIKEALETVQESAFTEAELEYYEKYWDSIRIEQVALEDTRDELEKTKLKEEEERRQKEEERKQKEEAQNKIKNAIKAMALQKIPDSTISSAFGISESEVKQLIKK
jgi:predicted transposase/invertase (TIGR01784 family)